MTPRNRILGDEGESIFSSWCLRAGLLPQKTSVDSAGWDFLVQEPARVDLSRMPFTAQVQVKTTRRARGYLDGISLFNWNALSKSPLPSFFVVIQVDDHYASKATLVHVDRRRISHALARIHTLEHKGVKNVGDRTMRLRWTEEDEFSEPFAENLRRGLEQYVGDPSDYASQKQEWLRSVGFEEGHHRIHFTATDPAGDNAARIFAELLVGIRESIPVDNFRACALRFGIETPSEQIPPREDASVSISIKPSKVHSVVASLRPLGSPLPQSQFVAEWRTTRGVGVVLPPEEHLDRVIAEHFSIVVGSSQATFTTHSSLKPLTVRDLEVLGICSSLFSRLGSRPVSIRCELEDNRDVAVIVGNIQSNQDAEPGHPLPRFAELMENAVRVAQSFGLPSHATFDLVELHRQREAIVAAGNLLLKPRKEGPSFEVSIQGGEADEDLSASVVGIPFLFRMYLGVFEVAGMFVLSGRPTSVEAGEHGQLVKVLDANVDLAFSEVWTEGDVRDVRPFVSSIESWMVKRGMVAVLPVEYNDLLRALDAG
jgi:hypothetical protein